MPKRCYRVFIAHDEETRTARVHLCHRVIILAGDDCKVMQHVVCTTIIENVLYYVHCNESRKDEELLWGKQTFLPHKLSQCPNFQGFPYQPPKKMSSTLTTLLVLEDLVPRNFRLCCGFFCR